MEVTKNQLIVRRGKKEEIFTYNDKNQLISINDEFGLQYFQSGEVKSVIQKDKTGKTIFETICPEESNSETICNYEYLTINEKLITKGYCYYHNENDSLLSYREDFYADRFVYRTYQNGTKVRKDFLEGGYKQDSILKTSDNKAEAYYFRKIRNRDSLVIVKDSIYTRISVGGKTIYKKTELQDKVYNEEFFDNDILVKRKQYFYFPVKNEKNIEWLWEIKTTNAKGSATKEYPNKKYWKLKDGYLVSKNNLEIANILGCGGYVNDEKSRVSFYHGYIYSPSVIISFSELSRFFSYYEFENLRNKIVYNRLMAESPKPILKIGDDFGTDQRLKRLFDRVIKSQYTVEVVTNNKKKYNINLSDKPENISFIIDVFAIDEY